MKFEDLKGLKIRKPTKQLSNDQKVKELIKKMDENIHDFQQEIKFDDYVMFPIFEENENESATGLPKKIFFGVVRDPDSFHVKNDNHEDIMKFHNENPNIRFVQFFNAEDEKVLAGVHISQLIPISGYDLSIAHMNEFSNFVCDMIFIKVVIELQRKLGYDLNYFDEDLN